MSKTGRNDPCPCGSGQKYKRCCFDQHEAIARTERDAFNAELQGRVAKVQELLQIDQEREELAFGMQAIAHLIDRGQMDLAREVAVDVLMRQRGGHEDYERLAKTCIERGEPNEAIQSYEKALEAVQAYPEAYFSTAPERYRILIQLLRESQIPSERADARSDSISASPLHNEDGQNMAGPEEDRTNTDRVSRRT